MRKLTQFIVALASCVVSLVHAQEKSRLVADHVEISFLAPKQFAVSQETYTAIHFKLEKDWHVYWKNPGDSGTAPKFLLKSPDASVGSIEWPLPERIVVGHLTNLGYSKEVAYPIKVKSDGAFVTIDAALEWLICKEECTPGFGSLELRRPVTEGTVEWDVGEKKIVGDFVAKVPSNSLLTDLSYSAKIIGKNSLVLTLFGLRNREPPEVYPTENEEINARRPQVQLENDKFLYTFAREAADNKSLPTRFVVGSSPPVEIEVTPSLTVHEEPGSYLISIAAAIIGGALLNCMPCVFPMLSIKLLGLFTYRSSTKPSLRLRLHESLLYTSGVLTTFGILGGTFIFLRTTGDSVGWGFQLQSPIFVLSLMLLFWLMALNFLGVFNFGSRIMNMAGKWRGSSTFATGALAVFIAAPCTGPFMGTALGAASVLPPLQAFLIFLALGLGLAAPFVLFILSPSLLKLLPKPGPWMESFKQILAFPLFATVIWLLWVLTVQIGSNGILAGGGLLLAASFLLWMFKTYKSTSRIVLGCAVLLLSIVVILLNKLISPSTTAHSVWAPYEEGLLAKARAEGRPVFVDFTAAWCITCQVNKKVVLETQAVSEMFKSHGVLALRADWTNNDKKVSSALKAFGRNSVPLYVYYPEKNAEPKLLPQILSIATIRNLF